MICVSSSFVIVNDAEGIWLGLSTINATQSHSRLGGLIRLDLACYSTRAWTYQWKGPSVIMLYSESSVTPEIVWKSWRKHIDALLESVFRGLTLVRVRLMG